MRFRVQLDMFAGPLDLLLYLVRKHELEVLEIPIARVAEQYLEILAVIEQIDVDAVGDFLEIATQLMEIKSRMMLPRHEELEEEPVDYPRHELVVDATTAPAFGTRPIRIMIPPAAATTQRLRTRVSRTSPTFSAKHV